MVFVALGSLSCLAAGPWKQNCPYSLDVYIYIQMHVYGSFCLVGGQGGSLVAGTTAGQLDRGLWQQLGPGRSTEGSQHADILEHDSVPGGVEKQKPEALALAITQGLERACSAFARVRKCVFCIREVALLRNKCCFT